MPRKRRAKAPKRVESFRHEEAKRPNLPSAEHQSVMSEEEQTPIYTAVKRRNLDLDPQLVWRGKNSDGTFEVQAPPLFIQEKVHPKALIDELKRVASNREPDEGQVSPFYDFNGLPSVEARTECTSTTFQGCIYQVRARTFRSCVGVAPWRHAP